MTTIIMIASAAARQQQQFLFTAPARIAASMRTKTAPGLAEADVVLPELAKTEPTSAYSHPLRVVKNMLEL